MADPIRIRSVNAEFLRAGPPHNQLLSPLTQYLAVCGDAGAGVVSVPYEQAAFERRLKELRYETGDPADRLAMLHDIGVDMGRILGAVPGLPGALNVDSDRAATLVHLRLTLSASELAHLPFELAKVPVGPAATAESWLAVQTRPPVCLTRNIRTVSPEGVVWPQTPRILFISAARDVVPYDEHYEALTASIEPFRPHDATSVKTSGGEQIGELLTVLEDPTLADVLHECQSVAYTHVHILAHGDEDETSRGSYGLVLRGQDGSADVVSGERFASALISVGEDRVHRPAVVSVAGCDSANVGTVAVPGASFAHALHQAGIPLVVASQFPLSMEGSVPLVRALYQGLLWGEHPLLLLQRARAELHARYTAMWHDWASLVVYEALPHSLGEQLDGLRYQQTRRAMNAALERIDRAVAAQSDESLQGLRDGVSNALRRMPFDGQYGVECLGLRASARKRLAQAAFTLAARAPDRSAQLDDPFDLLEQSYGDYSEAVRRLLVNDGRTVQRVATLHWVLVQSVSLAAVLAKDSDEGQWTTAKLCADLYCAHTSLEERAWAHASLAELYLLRLAEGDVTPALQRELRDAALEHARRLIGAYPFRDYSPVTSTLRQFRRYVDWWGDARFERALAKRSAAPRAPWSALVDAAKELIRLLEPANGGTSSGGSHASAGDEDAQIASAHDAPAATSARAAAARTDADKGSPRDAARRRNGGRAAAAATSARHEGAFFDIEMLPAEHGDALWIEYGDEKLCHRLLIDCGTQSTAPRLARRIDALATSERRFELFVMTHIDADHIGGALPLMRAVKQGLRFGDVWFNGWRHLSGQLGARQGEMFSTAIRDLELPWNAWRDGEAIVVDDDPAARMHAAGRDDAHAAFAAAGRVEEARAGMDARAAALRPRARLADRLQPLPQGAAVDVHRCRCALPRSLSPRMPVHPTARASRSSRSTPARRCCSAPTLTRRSSRNRCGAC